LLAKAASGDGELQSEVIRLKPVIVKIQLIASVVAAICGFLLWLIG